MKSASSEGSNRLSKLAINGGMYCVTLGPAVARIRANANRDYKFVH